MNTRSAAVCAILCVVFTILAYSAAAGKSATYDEPLHVATGWLNLWRGDFRLSPDVPPFWEYWIALPLGRDAMDFSATSQDKSLDARAIQALYQLPGSRGIELVNRSRWMSLLSALALAVLIAVWAGQLGGGVAAIAAMFVFVFDPNWLGHAPLAKNDVAFAMVYFAAAFAIWKVGARGTGAAVAAVVMLPVICLGTKLSGLVIGLLMPALLIGRALLPGQWILLNKTITTSGRKLAAAMAICLCAAVICYAGLWAQYRFRYDAGPDGLHLDMTALMKDLQKLQTSVKFQVNDPSPRQLAAWRPTFSTRAALWLQREHLTPEAWAGGFIYTQVASIQRSAFLMGQVYAGGRLVYFPLAWIFKEPLAMIVASLIGLVIWPWRKWNWNTAMLVVPAALYLLIAISSELNIGLRHIFPVFPFIDVGLGLVAARLWRSRGTRFVVLILAVGLLVETLAAYPDYISFFNVAFGGERGGLALLSDSNLDWGQDLPLLADWQKRHPSTPLYLEYFGTCDPAAYGIRYINAPGGYMYGPSPQTPGAAIPGVAAISASKYQGLFVADPAHDWARQFDRGKPIAVLGGSIYLFNYPP